MADRTTAVRDEYERLAGEYDERWSHYVAASVRETLRRAAVQAGEQVLDVGCGTGRLLDMLRRHRPSAALAGIDIAPAMLAAARQRLGPSVPLAVADVARLPFAPSEFDVVMSTSSFHYWPDPRAALAELARVLRPDGRLVLTDWCDDYLSCRVCDLALRLFDRAHRRAVGGDACRRVLEEAGYWVTVLDRYKINWLWGLMTAIARPLSSDSANASPQPP